MRNCFFFFSVFRDMIEVDKWKRDLHERRDL